MSSNQWYYAVGGNKLGPVSEDRLQEMFRTRRLDATTLVWTNGLSRWVEARSLDRLVVPEAPAASEVYAPAEYDDIPAATFQAYAGFWKRLAAWYIDVTIVLAISFAATFIYVFAYILMSATAEGAWLLGQIVGVATGWLYFALMESSRHQATLGKMACSIKVTNMVGDRISFGQATGRYFAKIITGLTLGIGYLMIFFTERKQALHDVMSSCLIVKECGES